MLAKALKARQARLQEEKGFTLIELLAVIVILGIIAVIAIPMIGNILDKSKEDGDIATARQVYDAARLYVIGEYNGDFKKQTVKLEEMQTGKYLEKDIVLPSSKEKLIEGTTVVFTDDGELETVTLKPSEGDEKSYEAAEVLSSKTKE